MKHWKIGGMIAVLLLASSNWCRADIIVGGFDVSRSGDFSFTGGSRYSSFRGDISSNYSGVTFAGTSTLNSNYLNSIDVLVLNSVSGISSAISPLSASEQVNLLSFVKNGGGLLAFTDNSSFEAANESILDPFGLDSTGAIAGTTGINIVGPADHPVLDGPFGQVTYMTSVYPGWFDTIGGSLTLGSFPSGNAIQAFEKGSLGVDSGRVVLFSDVSIAIDGSFGAYYQANNSVGVLNSFDYVLPAAVPEPSALTMFGLALCLCLARSRGRKLIVEF